MKPYIILLNLILIINNLPNLIESNKIGVPVLIWSKLNENKLNSNFDSIKSQSSVNQIPFNILSDDYLKSKTIIAFIQNDLSLEQFSNNENNLNTIKNIINDRTAEPLLLTDVLDPFEAIKDYSVQDIKQININNGQKVVINLPKQSLLENDELIGELLAKIGQNVTKNALYLITGRQNSHEDIIDDEIEEPEGNNHFGRHILSNEEYTLGQRSSNQTEDLKKLVTVGNNCLYFFTRFITVNQYNSSLSNISTPIVTFDEMPTVNNDSACWQIDTNKSEEISKAVLDLTYNNASYTFRMELHISTPFYRNRTDFWHVSNGSVVLSGDGLIKTKYDLVVSDISSENLFSYSCSKLTIMSKIQNETDGYPQISLEFINFQLQPFKNYLNGNNAPNNGTHKFIIFADSFDCETFMTLPLWMGLIYILLFFVILFTGIYFLSQVNTPDRFENPKGKPLIITSIDE